MSPRSRLAHLALVACLLAFLLPSKPVQAAGTTYSASPASVSATVILGNVADVELEISVPSGTAVRVTKAPPAAAEGQSTPAGPTRVPLPPHSRKVDPALLGPVGAGDEARQPLVVFLADQADLAPAYAIGDWAERGRWVHERLRSHAAQSQAPLQAELAAAGMHADSLWIVNALVVADATPALVGRLAGRADVALLRPSRLYTLDTPQEPLTEAAAACAADAAGVCWPLRAINVPQAWNDGGTRGAGVTVATVDSGALYTHPALIASYRGTKSATSFDHNYNWYDPDGKLQVPADASGHGTHTLGTIAGRGDGSAEQPIFGVAPAARWISAQGCDGNECEELDLIRSAQWLLAPTDLNGNSPRPELRPQIISNSWGDPSRQNDEWYAGYVAAWRAAGILPIFAAGNTTIPYPADCGSVDSPAEYSDVIAVGATTPAGPLASFSDLGPGPGGTLKPDLVAPGEQIVSAGITAAGAPALAVRRGTSMATPHVAGVVALLLAASPGLIGDFDSVYRTVTSTARRARFQDADRCGLGPDGATMTYGYGTVDAQAALAAVDVPWLHLSSAAPQVVSNRARLLLSLDARRVPEAGFYRAQLLLDDGSAKALPLVIPVSLLVTAAGGQQALSGSLTEAQSGQPLRATLAVSTTTGQAGPQLLNVSHYAVELLPGRYLLTASSPGYLSQSRSILVGDAAVQASFALIPDAATLAGATPPAPATLAFGAGLRQELTITNTGTRPLAYTLALPEETGGSYGVWRSDEPGAAADPWVDLPEGSPDLAALMRGDGTITDPVELGFFFPLYDYTYTATFVHENGVLAFLPPPRFLNLQRVCLPAEEQRFMLLMPFKADLDFARGGRLRHGPSPDGRGYLFSYEDVRTAAGAGPYSFQTALERDGTITFRYKWSGVLTERAGVGIQRSQTTYNSPGCGAAARLHSGLSIRFRRQAPPPEWLLLPAPSGQLAPGSSITLPIGLRWARGATGAAYRTALELTSDDPLHLHQRITVEARFQPARHEQRLLLVGR